jgi:apolipoprotein N-acyltransferase
LSANRKNRSKSAWRGVKGSALGMLLVPSALLTALAIGSADYSWFAWFGLLPLFFAIRILSPAVAALAGAFWGGCIYFFLVAGAVSSLSLTPHSFGLLATVLMLYTYFGGLLTRWIGFSPMLLALSWIVVELTLKPLGLRQGLLAGSQSANGFLHWISCLLGYAFVAMLVAGVNAWLVLLLSCARLRFPPPTIPTGLPNAERYPLSQTFVHLQFLPMSEIYPRPPPNID